MTAATRGAASSPQWRAMARPAALGAALVLLATATGLAANLAVGTPVLGLAPVLVALALWALIALPLRFSVSGLVFLTLAVDDRLGAEGRWHTPLSTLGDLLHFNIDNTLRFLPGLKLTGTEAIALLLLAVASTRSARARRRADGAHVRGPGVMRDLAIVAALAVGYGVVNGLSAGGNAQVALWQVRSFLDVVLLYFLFQAAYRGPIDEPLVWRTVLLAAAAKAFLAIWVRVNVAPFFARMEYTTSHGDSMLFVAAFAILVARLVERRERAGLLDAALFLPLVIWGTQANARRLAWVEMAFVLLLFFWVTDWKPWKRRLARATLLAIPLIALYVAVGWESKAGFFGPVATFRSVIDTRHDRSTWDRHVESWNIATTLRENPLRGRGFGREYSEYMPMDDISGVFPMYKAEPHNYLLGLMLFAGPIAFAGLVAMFGATIFLAARTYRATTLGAARASALVEMAIMLVVWVQTYGDMGILSPQAPVLSALAMALAAKAAVAHGAYPAGTGGARPWTQVLDVRPVERPRLGDGWGSATPRSGP